MEHRPTTHNAGFTLVEIIAVMVIIGIVGAMVVSRTGSDDSGTVSTKDRIKAHIRYAQILALKSNTVSGIDFNGSNYSIFTNGNTANAVDLGNGTTFTLPASYTQTLYFDLWGIPYTAYVSPGSNTPWTTGALGTLGLTLTADTGFVQ